MIESILTDVFIVFVSNYKTEGDLLNTIFFFIRKKQKQIEIIIKAFETVEEHGKPHREAET